MAYAILLNWEEYCCEITDCYNAAADTAATATASGKIDMKYYIIYYILLFCTSYCCSTVVAMFFVVVVQISIDCKCNRHKWIR